MDRGKVGALSNLRLHNPPYTLPPHCLLKIQESLLYQVTGMLPQAGAYERPIASELLQIQTATAGRKFTLKFAPLPILTLAAL